MDNRHMEIVMPKVGLTMTEGTLAQWHKREGDAVQKGELLFSFETEKSSLEYESPEAGVLGSILVREGQTVPCFTPVAVLVDGASAPATVAPSAQPAQAPQSSAASIHNPQSAIRNPPASPRSKLRAKEMGIDLAQVQGSGPAGAIRERDVLNKATMQQPAPAAKATPLAAKLAGELGVDLAQVQGSGPDGKITRDDVERAARAQLQHPSSDATARSISIQNDTPVEPPTSIANYQLPTPIRRVTAQRMSANAQAAPHVTLFTEADATELVSARNQLNAELPEKISYNTLLVAICAKALREQPAINASWHDAGIVVHSSIHIGLAVDTPRGLLVPVIRDAGAKPIAQLHRDVTDAVARAGEGKSKPDELSGGTFTITNLGMFEIDGFTPIINLPEAAILGVGRIAPKPAAKGEQVVVRQMLTLSLSFDHRVVDGAPAGRFLQRIKQLIERPFALMM
jgi:pyruvate dehydrogenase E2 component (dihydrolipoamide acetyltransferase)